MSDNLRKGLGEQASEKSEHMQPSHPPQHNTDTFAVTPDSQKSTTSKIGENVSGAADKAASAVQPGEHSSLPLH
jgi:hypothetical protein